MSAPTMRRDLSLLTSASLEGGNVVLRELTVSGRVGVVHVVTPRPEERRALATFLAEVEAAGERFDEEPQCGAIREEDDAVCVELEDHRAEGGSRFAGPANTGPPRAVTACPAAMLQAAFQSALLV